MGATAGGGLLSFFAVGCPICNEIVVALIGVGAALSFVQPVQPYMALAGLALGEPAVAVGVGAGYIVGHASRTSAAPAVAAGQVGTPLTPTELGDATVGAQLFVSKGCADCHSYGGKGGSDAPPLDFMSGHLSARDVAEMSGRIWNHLPAMLGHFEEEGVAVRTFEVGTTWTVPAESSRSPHRRSGLE